MLNCKHPGKMKAKRKSLVSNWDYYSQKHNGDVMSVSSQAGSAEAGQRITTQLGCRKSLVSSLQILYCAQCKPCWVHTLGIWGSHVILLLLMYCVINWLGLKDQLDYVINLVKLCCCIPATLHTHIIVCVLMCVCASICMCVCSLDKQVTSGMWREDYKTIKEPSEAEEDLSKSMELFLCYSSQETPPSSKQAFQLENIFRF